MKKDTMKKATIKTPVKDLKGGETIEHYNAVLLEDIRSKMDSAKVTLKDEMKNLEERLTQEIELLKTVVHEHSGGIRMESLHLEMIRNNTKENNLQIVATNQKIGEISSNMQKMEENLANKIDKIGSSIDGHETRITALEAARL